MRPQQPVCMATSGMCSYFPSMPSAENGGSEPTLTDAARCPNDSNAQKADFAKSRYGIKTDAYRCLGCSRIDSQKRSLIFCTAYPSRLRVWIAEQQRHLNFSGSKPDRLRSSVVLRSIKACIRRTRSPYTSGLRFSFSTSCLPNSAFSLSIQTDHAESPQ